MNFCQCHRFVAYEARRRRQGGGCAFSASPLWFSGSGLSVAAAARRPDDHGIAGIEFHRRRTAESFHLAIRTADFIFAERRVAAARKSRRCDDAMRRENGKAHGFAEADRAHRAGAASMLSLSSPTFSAGKFL